MKGLSLPAKTALVAAIVVAGGCYESESPLDPAPKADLDQALLGTWRCLPINADADEEPATLSVARAPDRRYAITWRESEDDPVQYEAFASSVDGQRFLNVREKKPEGFSGKWMFVRASLLRPNVLHIDVVDAAALKGVEDSAAAVRRAIARKRSNPALTIEFAVCARAKVDAD